MSASLRTMKKFDDKLEAAVTRMDMLGCIDEEEMGECDDEPEYSMGLILADKSDKIYESGFSSQNVESADLGLRVEKLSDSDDKGELEDNMGLSLADKSEMIVTESINEVQDDINLGLGVESAELGLSMEKYNEKGEIVNKT